MKPVKSKSGETEMQTPEYLPDGPVIIPATTPDTRPMVNRADGTPAAKAPERPVYETVGRAELLKRIEVLEAQVKSLQLSTRGRIGE